MIDVTDDQVLTAVGDFLALATGIPAYQAQENRVPPPRGDFVMYSQSGKRRLAMPANTYADIGKIGSKDIIQPTEYTIQVDFYGPNAADHVQELISILSDGFGWDVMPVYIKPLTASEPVQMPLVNAEKQYEERWKVSAIFLINPAVTVPMQFFDTVDLTTKPI